MDNIVKFKTDNIPLVTQRSKFPYDDVINSLKVLTSTKAIVFEEDEIKHFNIVRLRGFVEELKLGYLRNTKKNGKHYLWLNSRKED